MCCLNQNYVAHEAPGADLTPAPASLAEERALNAEPQSAVTLQDLDLKDTAILKALAITAIILHNFFHLIGPTHQNEFSFSAARFPLFVQTMLRPELAFQAFFTFFGHFGVQVFIFLSAYGLAKSHWNDGSSWAGFMWRRVKKLYPDIGLAVLPWVIINCFLAGPSWFVQVLGLQTLLLLLGVSTILGFGLPVVGPWWFIAFIVQFYAMWLPLRSFAKKFGWLGLICLTVLCVGLIYAANSWLAHFGLNLLLTPMGRMKSICLGIAAARYPLRIPGWLAIASVAVLMLGSAYYAVWPLSFLAALLIFLWSYMALRDTLRRLPLLERLGRYSLLAFLLNGLVRLAFLPYATTPAKQLLYGAAELVTTFACSAIIYEVVHRRRRVVAPARPLDCEA